MTGYVPRIVLYPMRGDGRERFFGERGEEWRHEWSGGKIGTKGKMAGGSLELGRQLILEQSRQKWTFE